MQDRERPRQESGAEERAPAAQRLEPGKVYYDPDNPERGPFVATGDEIMEPGSTIVAEEDFDADAWRTMVREGWGERTGGRGHFSHDQGAFGTETNPRSDVINAGPPGVGEGLTPKENEEEDRRR